MFRLYECHILLLYLPFMIAKSKAYMKHGYVQAPIPPRSLEGTERTLWES
jgi:hypothetical protein